MEFGDRQETRLLMDDELAAAAASCSSSSSSFPPLASTCLCRICHEEEEESSTSMESPCACSGTLKFAHRECIQRWCDEKGSNVCEICLQVFEPGYTVPEKDLVDVAVTIRGSLGTTRLNYDPESSGFVSVSDDAEDSTFIQCSTASQRSASCYRSVAFMFMLMLLIRHFIAVIAVGADHYAFGILTVFLLRASGIILPFYLVMRFISAIQQAQLQYQLEQLRRGVNSSIDGMEEEEEEDEELEHHVIQIRS